MKQSSLLQKLAITGVTGVISVISFQGSAEAFQIFFGEDLGLGEAVRLPATPNTDSAEASFISSLQGTGTEDFESQIPGKVTPLPLIFPGNIGSTINATLVSSGEVVSGFVDNIPTGTNGFGRYPTSGDQFFNDVSSELDIFFDQDVAAFGFKGIDIGDVGGQIIADFKNDGTLIASITVPSTINAPGGGVLFFGFIAEDSSEFFDEIDFTDTAPGVDLFGYDDMEVGDPGQIDGNSVPEPGTVFGLLAIGSLGLVLKHKKQA